MRKGNIKTIKKVKLQTLQINQGGEDAVENHSNVVNLYVRIVLLSVPSLMLFMAKSLSLQSGLTLSRILEMWKLWPDENEINSTHWIFLSIKSLQIGRSIHSSLSCQLLD